MAAQTATRETVVLLVEDDRDDFFLTQDLLKGIDREPHRVVWAASYEAAKNELEERSFDVALVDYRIDGRTGLEFISQVGCNFPQTPMILLTGLQDPGLDLAAQQAGAADYLAKDNLTVELLDRSIRYARQNTQKWSLLDTVLTNAAAGVISLNAAGVPVVWNKRALDAVGVPNRGAKETGAALREALLKLCVDGALPEEFTSADSRSYQLVATKGPDDSLILVFHDISSRTKLEQLLRQAALDAEAANQAKSNFIATISHELRTPLNGILGMSRVLSGSRLSDSQRDHIGIIRSSGESLLQIINDILDLSKIEAGRVEIDDVQFELSILIEEVMKLLAPTAFAKGVELVAFVDPLLPQEIRGDPLRIKQVMINVIGNAIKFTTSGSVTVLAKLSKVAENPRLHVEVVDTGSGVDPEKAHQLFKKFSQLDSSTTRNHSGTGLGLALCKELVRLMNGEIWHEPARAHSGSSFQFHLPLDREHEAIEMTRRGFVRAASGSQVLLASPSVAIARVVENYASVSGCKLVWAKTEDDARAAIAADEFSAILYDGPAEGEFARAFVQEIRRAPRGARSVVLIEEFPPRSSPQSIAAAGFDEALQRPVGSAIVEVFQRRLKSDGAAAEGLPAEAEAEEVRLNILMAEDNAPNRMVASALLKAAGHSLVMATDGLEAVSKAASRRYDVILMDVQMPGIDGLEATRRIRALPTCTDIPIIGLTAGAMQIDRDRCLQAGMTDYLAKPVDWDRLLGLLDKIENERSRLARAS